MQKEPILIAGAGVAGPTLARMLVDDGHELVVVERAPAFRTGGYMVDFWGIGYAVAERLGLIPALRERGYFVNHVKFVDAKGDVVSGFGGDIFARNTGGRFFSIPRGDLAQTIWDTVKDKVEVHFGDGVTAIQDDGDGVEVTFEKAKPRRFAWVAGCDGLHSAVRHAVFGPQEQYEKYLGYQVASFITHDYPRRDEHTYLSFGAPGRQMSRYGLRGNRTAFLFVFKREGAQHPHGLEEQKRVLRDVFGEDEWVERPEIMARLDRADELYYDSVSQIHMPAWSRGRTVLVGDAAHCPSLLAGEGTSFAMGDAYILAGELRAAGGDHARAFATYESKLRTFIEKKQHSAERFAHGFAPETAFGLHVRNLVLHLAAIPWIGDMLMRHFVTDDFTLPEYPR